MRPSGWMATELATSMEKPDENPVSTIPPVPKVVSRLPSGLYRATAMSSRKTGTARPTATSLPSGCTATSDAALRPPGKSVSTLPPAPNAGSSAPPDAPAPARTQVRVRRLFRIDVPLSLW
jgi:hypothetical protein